MCNAQELECFFNFDTVLETGGRRKNEHTARTIELDLSTFIFIRALK